MAASMRLLPLVVLFQGAAAAARSEAGVTPIQKVLTMMNDMVAKAKAEKEAEEVSFSEFKQFCKSNLQQKEQSIVKGKDKAEQLAADIDTATSQAEGLAKEIGQLDTDMASWEGELKEEGARREKAHADFVGTHDEYTESIASVKQAVDSLKAGGGASFAQQGGGWTSLLELQRTTAPARARRVIESFLQRNVDTHSILLEDAEEIDGTETKGQSGGVLDMVEKLGDKFEEEREKLEKTETSDAHAFTMMQQDLTNQMNAAKRAADKKTAAKGEAESTKAEAEGDLADVKGTLAEDEKFLSDLSAECEQKAMEFEKNQETRQGEIDAILKAIEIMSSDKVSLEQQGESGATALLHLRRSESRSMNQGLVGRFLEQRAHMVNSQVLSLLSVRVQNDPFKKVTKMIKDMIQKLMEEASEEAEHKGFCDTELGTNKITRDSKSEEAASLQAEVDELTADIAKLGKEIADYGAAISELDAAMSKATAIRTEEKEKNTATVEDAKVAQEAVAQALTVLKDFYEKAAKSAALAQETSGSAGGQIAYDSRAMAILDGGKPALVQEPYKGMESGGVVGMLEVIASDFARLESETASAEAEAAQEYTEFSNDSAMDKAMKSTDMKHKEQEKVKKESALASSKKDLAGTTSELDAAMAYFEKLKPSCVDAGESYEERVARRKEEIESLQEALKVLTE